MEGRTGESGRRPGIEAGQGAKRLLGVWGGGRVDFWGKCGLWVLSELPPGSMAARRAPFRISVPCCVTKRHKPRGLKQTLSVPAHLRRTEDQGQKCRPSVTAPSARGRDLRSPREPEGVLRARVAVAEFVPGRGTPVTLPCRCPPRVTVDAWWPASFLAGAASPSLVARRTPTGTLVAASAGVPRGSLHTRRAGPPRCRGSALPVQGGVLRSRDTKAQERPRPPRQRPRDVGADVSGCPWPPPHGHGMRTICFY